MTLLILLIILEKQQFITISYIASAHILENLKIIGEESAKKGEEFEPLTKQIVECLENLASKIDSNSQKLSGNTQNQLVEYYEYIKSKYHTYETTKDALEALKNREKRDISDIYCLYSYDWQRIHKK